MCISHIVINVRNHECANLRYHIWMEDVHLRQLTASELLTLEEEYKMQLSWLNDERSKQK